MKKLYIIHGYEACPSDHWFAWLKNKLKGLGFETNILNMPNSEKPDAFIWQQTLKNSIDLDEDTYIIAHSLGCIATLNFLSKHSNNTAVKALILVSGFKKHLPNLKELDNFIHNCSFNSEKIQALSQNKAFFISTNDNIVTPDLSLDLADALNINPIYVKNAGHFMQSDGYEKFPQLLDTVKSFIE